MEKKDNTQEEKDVKDMTPEEIDALKYKKREEQHETIDKIIKGVNDVWEKEYNFEDIDLHFTVKVRVPNAIEQGRIFGLRSSYLNGMDMYQTQEVIEAFQMLAVLQVVGVDVPKEYRNPDEVYNLTPLVVMYQDWDRFLRNFRY